MAARAPTGDSRPVVARSRPRPASTFSLNTVQIARPSSRYITRRTEFDPTSIAAAVRGLKLASESDMLERARQVLDLVAAAGERRIGHEAVVSGKRALAVPSQTCLLDALG